METPSFDCAERLLIRIQLVPFTSFSPSSSDVAHMAHVIERVHVHMPLASLWGWNPSIDQMGLHW